MFLVKLYFPDTLRVKAGLAVSVTFPWSATEFLFFKVLYSSQSIFVLHCWKYSCHKRKDFYAQSNILKRENQVKANHDSVKLFHSIISHDGKYMYPVNIRRAVPFQDLSFALFT